MKVTVCVCDRMYVVLVKMFLMVAVYVSAAFQLYFAAGIMWAALRVRITSPCLQASGLYILRIFILACSCKLLNIIAAVY